MYKVKISKTARADLMGIMGYIALDNPKRAESFVQEMLNMAKSILSSFPLAGRVASGSRRVLVYGGYYVIYKINEERGEVVLSRVINPANYTAYKNLINFE